MNRSVMSFLLLVATMYITGLLGWVVSRYYHVTSIGKASTPFGLAEVSKMKEIENHICTMQYEPYKYRDMGGKIFNIVVNSDARVGSTLVFNYMVAMTRLFIDPNTVFGQGLNCNNLASTPIMTVSKLHHLEDESSFKDDCGGKTNMYIVPVRNAFERACSMQRLSMEPNVDSCVRYKTWLESKVSAYHRSGGRNVLFIDIASRNATSKSSRLVTLRSIVKFLNFSSVIQDWMYIHILEFGNHLVNMNTGFDSSNPITLMHGNHISSNSIKDESCLRKVQQKSTCIDADDFYSKHIQPLVNGASSESPSD